MDTLGKYRIIGELGEGGFGHVYKARDPSCDRLVAIKVLNKQNDEDMVRRFRAEATTGGRLAHKNIVTVFDFEEENGVQYLVMEYLNGQDLRHLLERTIIAPLDKLSIMAEVAEGLQYAHEHGVIHRDVKPANIMWLTDGSVKIMDFGIARLTQKDTRITELGFIVGTPEYMAPEQFTGDGADAQCDVWAFGVVLYEFLTGLNPFRADTALTTMYRVINEDPPPLNARVAGLPPGLEPMVQRLLTRDKEKRYPSMEDLRLDLGPVIQELGRSQVPGMEIYAENLIRDGKDDEAQVVVARIFKFDPANTKARKWRIELKERKQLKARAERTRALIEEARDRSTLLDFWGAVARLQDALRNDPGNVTAKNDLAQARAEAEKRDRAASLTAEARTDLERRALTSAFERASEAVQTDPANADAAALLSQVMQAVAERDAEARRAAGLAKARGLLLVQEYASAVAILQELATQYPNNGEVADRLSDALRLQAVDEAERRVAATIAEIKGLLRNGEFQKAIDSISKDSAICRNPQAQDLLTYAREQLDQQRREAEIEELLAEAAAHAARGEYDPALAVIDRVLESSPGNEKAQRSKKAVLADRRRDEENKAIEGEIRQCRELIEADRLEEAQPRVRTLSEKYPEHRGAKEVVREFGVRVQRREEAKRKEVESGRREAELLLAQQKPEEASELLKTLSIRYKDENVFSDLLRRAGLMEREKLEREAVNAVLAAVRKLCDASRWDDARMAIEQGLSSYPQSATLTTERQRILREADLQRLLDEIQQKLASHETDSARSSAEAGLRRFPGERRLEGLLQQATNQSEWEELLRRAEALIMADQIEEGGKVLPELARRAAGDANLARLQALLEEKQQRRRTLAAADESRKHFEFQQARDLLRSILKKDPADAAAHALLDVVERDNTAYGRRQKVAAVRVEADRLSKRKEYAAAVQVLGSLADEFPNDAEIQEDLRRAQDLRDQWFQKEAYSRGRQEFDALMRARRFDQAIAKAQELIASFAPENDLQDDLHRAIEGRDKAALREAYSRGRKELQALLKGQEFKNAITKAEELCAAFPDEPEAPIDLRRAREAGEEAERERKYSEGRKEVEALMKGRNFEGAIGKLEELAASFPDEPDLPNKLRLARTAWKQALREEAIVQGRKDLDALMENREFERAIAKAEELSAAFPDEHELQNYKRKATDAWNQARKGSYAQSCSELDQMMKRSQFDEVISRATALLEVFPNAPELQDYINNARTARNQAERSTAYSQSRSDLDRLMKNRQFEQAVDATEKLIARFPDEPELPEILRRAREGIAQAARKEAYAQGRGQFEAFMRDSRYDQAAALAERMLAAFPEEPELPEMVRRAKGASDRVSQQRACAQGRKDLESLIRNRQYERAVDKAEKLAAEFPDEPQVQEDLRRARELHNQATRQQAYGEGRQEFERLMRNAQVEPAIAKAKELIAVFPEESGLQDDLKRAMAAARQKIYDRGRGEFDDLMKARQFEAAIEKGKALAKEFPDDPVIRQDLQRALSARQFRDRNAELETDIAELEALFRKGDTVGVRKLAQKVLRKCDDPRALQLLKWADQSEKDAKAWKGETTPPENRNRRRWWLVTATLVPLISIGLFELLKPPAAALLSAKPTELSFVYQAGDPLPAGQPIDVSTSREGIIWTVRPGDRWLTAVPDREKGNSQVSLGVAPDGLPAGHYSGIATITAQDSPANPVKVRVNLTVNSPVPSSPPGQLTASPTQFSFVYNAGGVPPAAQTINVSAGSEGMRWSVKASDRWIKTVPDAEKGSAKISLAVAPDGVPVGEHTGIVTIAAEDRSVSLITLRVALTVKNPVLRPPSGQLSASPSELSFAYQTGGASPPAQTINVSAGAEGMLWSAKTSDRWIKAVPDMEKGNAKVSLGVVPDGLPAGDHTGTATIAAQDRSVNPITVRVTLTVKSPEPPPPSIPPLVNCLAAGYGGLLHGRFTWVGVLDAQQSVTIHRLSRSTAAPAGRVNGDPIPGCAVTVTATTGGVIVTQPTEGDNFSSVTITNNGNVSRRNFTFEWVVK